LTRSSSSIRRRRTHLDEGELMAEKDGEDVEDQEDDTEDPPPESIMRQCPRRGPPSSAELRDLNSKLRAVDDAYTRLVAFKIGAHDIGPESRKHLHQDVLTRFWTLVKQYGVSFDLSATLTSIVSGTLDNDQQLPAQARESRGACPCLPRRADRPSMGSPKL
jgi:hypothetical protein